MKTGIAYSLFRTAFTCYGDDKFKKIKEFGFDTIDFDMMATDTDLYLLPKEESNKILIKERELAKDAGIFISQVHGPWCWPPPEATPEGKIKRMEEMKRSLYNASVLGSKYTVIHPIMPYFTEEKGTELEEKTWQENIDFFKELADYAGEVGVTVCIENMPMKKFSIATPEEIIRLVQTTGNPNVKYCLDVGHVSVFDNLNIGDEIRRLGSDLKVLHVHDNFYGEDLHLLPYRGVTDWKSFMDGLRDINFEGSVSLEIFAPDHMPVEFREDYYRLASKIAKHIVNQ